MPKLKEKSLLAESNLPVGQRDILKLMRDRGLELRADKFAYLAFGRDIEDLEAEELGDIPEELLEPWLEERELQEKGLRRKADAHTDWMNECVPELIGHGKDQLVAVAACLNMWRDAWEESHPDGADDPGPSPKEASEDSPLQQGERRVRFVVIDDRAASVIDFPGEAPMVKIAFDDGEIRLAIKERDDALRLLAREQSDELIRKQREQEADKRRKSQWRSHKRRAALLLGKHGDHDQSTHGNWADGGGGGEESDRPKAAVAGYKEGVKARGDAVEKVRDQWVKESPIKTIEDVIRDAPEAQRVLGEVGNRIAAAHGVKFKNPTAKTQTRDEKTGEVIENPKGVARILEKIADREAAGKPTPMARVTDTARGTFVLNHPDDAEKVIGELAKTHEVVDEGWRTIPDSHYTDRPLLFRDRGTGLIGEIQLTHPELLDAKDNQGGHQLYEASRSLPKGHPDIPKYNAKMQALYGKSLDKLDDDWKIIDGRWTRR